MLNGTFFLQILHFYIAYIIIERLLFAPALKELFADRAHKEKLKSNIDNRILAIERLEHSQEKMWQDAKHAFSSKAPLMKQVSIHAIHQQLPHALLLNESEKNTLTQECALALAKELEHVT